MTYWIFEDNVERLEKHGRRLAKKAGRPVIVATGKSEIRTEGKRSLRYVEFWADDSIIRKDGWRYVATIEHKVGGNVIRRYDESAPPIPDVYRTAAPHCDHCHTDRDRKDTYLVYNEENETWAQLGRSCLREYTGGLSPDAVAAWVSLWDELISCAAPIGSGYSEYYKTDEILRIASEIIRLHGYAPTRCPEDVDPYTWVSTRERVSDRWRSERGLLSHALFGRDAWDRIYADNDRGYDAESVDLSGLYEWAEGLSGSEYSENVRVLCAQPYVEARDIGILCSVPHVFQRSQRKQKENKGGSRYIGEVGKRIEVSVKDGHCVASWETVYGTTYLYRWTTEDGGVVTWKTSKGLRESEITRLVGTVKAHTEYRGTKQTELTRCKEVKQ